MIIECENSKPIFVPFAASEYSVIEGMKTNEASEYTERLITDLITHSRCSLSQLTKAVDLHNYSLCSPDYNSSFLNLWSVLEVLSLKEIATNDLEQASGTLLPVLQAKYFYAITNNFAQQLKLSLDEGNYVNLLKRVNGDGLEKIANFLFCDEYNELRREYKECLTDFPVLRHRIHFLSEKAKNKRDMLSLVETYRQRVEWHLSRIYRTRNSLIHSGNTPDNIRFLGEHLHYYVDLLMMEMFSKLSCGVQFCTVNNALLDSILACDTLKKQLGKKEPISETDICTLINPIFTKQDKFEYVCDCK